jgi:hypothetical protein
MDLLQFLISFFTKELGEEKIAPILNVFKDNSFNFSKLLSPEFIGAIMPLINELFKGQNKTPTDFSVGEEYKLAPIAKIADKDIIYQLNRYFS